MRYAGLGRNIGVCVFVADLAIFGSNFGIGRCFKKTPGSMLLGDSHDAKFRKEGVSFNPKLLCVSRFLYQNGSHYYG